MKNLKQPQEPTKPVLPREPTLPEKEIKAWEDFPISQYDNLEEIVNKANEMKIALSDVIFNEFEIEFNSNHDYYCRDNCGCSPTYNQVLKPQYSKMKPNPFLFEENQRYNNLKKKYNKRIIEYNKQLKKYPAKLEKYKKELELYKIEVKKFRMKDAQDQIKNYESLILKIKSELDEAKNDSSK
mgnify:CR=1 FL=1